VLEFLADCHERSICYGDVKPNNFVLRSLYPCLAHLMDPRKPRGYLDVVAVDFGCCQEVGEHCLPDAKVMGVWKCWVGVVWCGGVRVFLSCAGGGCVVLYGSGGAAASYATQSACGLVALHVALFGGRNSALCRRLAGSRRN
jgi:serine/threonine protein kinase